jgi:hypothetical protein
VTPAPDPSTWKLPKLAIDRDGAWHAEEGEVTHPGLLASLRSSLRVDAEGYHIQIGPARVPVDVEDAPYSVVRVELDGPSPSVILSDLSRESLRLDTLVFGPGDIPYCRVREGSLDARFSPAAAWQLLQRVELDEATGGAVLALPGRPRQPIPTVSRSRPPFRLPSADAPRS